MITKLEKIETCLYLSRRDGKPGHVVTYFKGGRTYHEIKDNNTEAAIAEARNWLAQAKAKLPPIRTLHRKQNTPGTWEEAGISIQIREERKYHALQPEENPAEASAGRVIAYGYDATAKHCEPKYITWGPRSRSFEEAIAEAREIRRKAEQTTETLREADTTLRDQLCGEVPRIQKPMPPMPLITYQRTNPAANVTLLTPSRGTHYSVEAVFRIHKNILSIKNRWTAKTSQEANSKVIVAISWLESLKSQWLRWQAGYTGTLPPGHQDNPETINGWMAGKPSNR